MFKKFLERFKRTDKVFVAGFTCLTLLSLALNGIRPLWVASTVLGFSFIAWQVLRND